MNIISFVFRINKYELYITVVGILNFFKYFLFGFFFTNYIFFAVYSAVTCLDVPVAEFFHLCSGFQK